MSLEPCRECGRQVSTEASSCPGCGVPEPTRHQSASCWECGETVDESAPNCPSCGAPDPASDRPNPMEVDSPTLSGERAQGPSDRGKPGYEPAREDGATEGLGGWLAFFIFTLFLGAIVNVLGGIATMPYGVIDLGLGAWMFACGVLLVQKRPNAVDLTKKALWAVAAYGGLVVLIGAADGDGELAGVGLRSLVYAGIWLAYLTRSERVRATFP